MQASRSSTDAVRQIGQSQMGLILICIWILVMEYRWKFCYLGDSLDADGGCHSAVTARVRYTWKSSVNTYLF